MPPPFQGEDGAYTASYSYNGAGTRVAKTEGGVPNAFKRDGVGVTAPVLADSYARYTPGVSENRGSTPLTSVTKYMHSGTKSADTQTNASQTIDATRKYDAFGAVLSGTGTWSGPFGNAGKFGYQEDATGYQLLGHRYYDPSTGRFLTRDPIQDGRNWYSYCRNNPLGGADPTGLVQWAFPWQNNDLIAQGSDGIRPGIAPDFDDPFFNDGASSSGQGGGRHPSHPPGISPYDTFKPRNPIDDNNDQTWWDEWLNFLVGTVIEEGAHNPIPIDAVQAPLGIPYNGFERKRQQEYEQANDPYGDGDRMTWEQSPEYHKTPYIPIWTR